MRWSISDTAEYGDFTRGQPRDRRARARKMREVLGEIQDGTFAREWIAEMDAASATWTSCGRPRASGRSSRSASSSGR